MPVNFVAKAAITVALTAANYALQASRKIEGPRLEELGASVGDYGVPIPDIFGTRRINPPVFWAEDLREVKRRRKTKGGKYNEYTYYGTWACALAAHEIDGVTRIWFDTHLVYDATGTGPLSPFDFGGTAADIDDFIAIYTGTMAQSPDERMAATVEAEHGAGSCPAYHGIAYIVFKDLPLEKLGNRIPQVSVEVVSALNGIFPTYTLTAPAQTVNLQFTPDYSTLAFGPHTEFVLVDTAARSVMVNAAYSPAAENTNFDFALLETGDIVAVGEVTNDPAIYTLSGAGTTIASTSDTSGIEGFFGADGTVHWYSVPLSQFATVMFDGADYDLDALTGSSFTSQCGCGSADGSLWLLGAITGITRDHLCVYRIGGGMPTFWLVDMGTDDSAKGAVAYQDADQDWIIVGWEGNLVAIDVTTGTIAATLAVDYPSGLTTDAFRTMAVGAKTIWIGFEEIDLQTLTRVRLLDATDWASTEQATIYDPVNHALITTPGGSTIRWHFLDRIEGNGVTLGAIAANRAVKVGVEDYDFTTLDQIIPGWSVTQGQASSQLEPLFDAYDSDILPHEFEIIGKKRAGVSASTLLTENFVANEPRYTARVRQSAELPFALTYNFADLNADQQPNNVRVARPQDATAGRDERSIDMTTLANDADGMRGLAERHFRRMHGERREFDLGLTTWQLALEPGDVHTLDLDGDQLSARLLKTVIAPAGTIQTEWKYDHASFAVLSGANGAEMDGRPVTTIAVPVLSKGFFLDIPYLTDSDARTPPSIYIAAGPYAAGSWPGAVGFQAIDGEYSDEIGAVPSSSAATWGYANDTLPDRNPWLWDRLSSINVTVQNGTLTGCTEAQIDADPSLNLALIGDELVNFTTATLEIDGTYTLSGFKRGRRGTEWACSTHGARDVFLLMDTAQTVNMGLSEVDTDLSFKMITSGRSSAFPEDLEPFNGASLMPYAPCQLTAELDGSDWVFTWVRRTRIGGAWTGGASIPLSEASEEYALYLGDGVTTVTKTVTSATTYTWTAAQQTTDTGSGVTSGELTFSMAQVSDAVGAGFVAAY